MGEEELSNGARIPRQQFSIGPSAQAVLNLPDDLCRGKSAMPKRGALTHADQASDMSNFQIGIAPE